MCLFFYSSVITLRFTVVAQICVLFFLVLCSFRRCRVWRAKSPNWRYFYSPPPPFLSCFLLSFFHSFFLSGRRVLCRCCLPSGFILIGVIGFMASVEILSFFFIIVILLPNKSLPGIMFPTDFLYFISSVLRHRVGFIFFWVFLRPFANCSCFHVCVVGCK